MSDSTPNLSLPYILAAQAQKHVTHNEALRSLDVLVQLAVGSRAIAVPPPAPTNGERYIVPAGASGLWAGKAGNVAAFQDGAWQFHPPREGWQAWVSDEGLIVGYQGSSWSVVAGTGSSLTNSWSGMAGTALGTSIVSDGTWLAALATTLGITLTNLGVSSGAWSSTASLNPLACYNQVANVPADARLILIEGATNDFRNDATLGVLGDATTATFYGAIWRAIVDARAIAPNALIVVCPIYATGWAAGTSGQGVNGLGRKYEEYSEAMRQVARVLSCPVINLGDSGIVGMGYPAAPGGNDTTDGTHLSAGGATHLAEFVAGQVKLLRPRPLYNQVATPTFSPAAGTYGGSQSVTIASATAGATIHYTTDGSTPTTGSPVYSSAISVPVTTTIRALAVKAGMTNSAVATAAYTIASFTPSSVSPLAWYDPSDLATLWQDTAGTVAVTADGQSVARIDDKSGNGHHLTQADAARRPLYKTSGGLHWLDFDGSNDWIGKAFTIAFPSSRVSALRYPAAQSEWGTFFNSHTGNATRLFMRAPSGQFNSFNGAYPGASATVALSADIAVAETWTGDSASKYVVNNGAPISGSEGTISCDGFLVGANGSGGGSPAAFRWYGSVIKGAVMTDTQLGQLGTWLGAKAGITV